MRLMRRYTWILNTIFWALLIHTATSHSMGEESSKIDRNLLSVDFSKTSLNLSLLGTVTREGFRTAIIKNTVTGKLKTYAEGEMIDLISTEEVKLERISDCTIMIERKGSYETLSCNRGNHTADRIYDETLSETAIYRLLSPLAKYKVLRKPKEDNNRPSKFKSIYENEIIVASKKHGVDPYLVRAVIKAESNFNPLAVSPKNAVGMMQLIPEAARDYGVGNPFDPEENIDGGVRLLKDLINYFNGDLELALAAYNAGKGSVIKHGFRIPPYTETMDYVDKVLGYYSLLKWNRYEWKR